MGERLFYQTKIKEKYIKSATLMLRCGMKLSEMKIITVNEFLKRITNLHISFKSNFLNKWKAPKNKKALRTISSFIFSVRNRNINFMSIEEVNFHFNVFIQEKVEEYSIDEKLRFHLKNGFKLLFNFNVEIKNLNDEIFLLKKRIEKLNKTDLLILKEFIDLKIPQENIFSNFVDSYDSNDAEDDIDWPVIYPGDGVDRGSTSNHITNDTSSTTKQRSFDEFFFDSDDYSSVELF